MRDNHKIQTENARKIFLRYDQQKIIHTFELKHHEIFLFLNFLHRPYRICRKTGAVEYETPQKLWITAGFHEVLSIYDMLCNPNGKPVLSGSWSPVGNLGRMHNASEAVGESSLSTYGKYFTGKGKELTEICQSLGGSPAPVGDAAFYLPVFDFFPVYLRFYDADEEFPAQLQLLWDKNTCNYIHYETTFYIAAHLFQTLLEKL